VLYYIIRISLCRIDCRTIEFFIFVFALYKTVSDYYYRIKETNDEQRLKRDFSFCRTIIAAVSALVAGFGAVILFKGLQAARSSK
jgi:hypothetical protein